jgi:hypothetical protein
MHKAVILLVKKDDMATDPESIEQKVNEFMEQYGEGDVWDWYVIGGRWSGTLLEHTKPFYKKAEDFLREKYPNEAHGFITTTMVEEQADALQAIWIEMGGQNVNPYNRDQYVMTGNYSDDIMPLIDCIPIINDWALDMKEEAENCFAKILEEKKKEKLAAVNGEKIWPMSGYYAGKYHSLSNDSFSFDSNVYDIDNQTNDPGQALSEPENYFAVMIDMHN